MRLTGLKTVAPSPPVLLCPCLFASGKAAWASSHGRKLTTCPSSNPNQQGERSPASPPSSTLKKSLQHYEEGELVLLGEIKAAHGIKGEVKVDIVTDSPARRFGKSGTKLLLRQPQPSGLLAAALPEASTSLFEVTTEGFKVQPIANGNEVWILKLAEVHDRTQAELLRHYSIVMPRSAREQLRDPDEFYAQDLIGCHVFMQAEARYVGRVVDLLSGFGTHDTLLLHLRPTAEDLGQARSRACMVPFVKEMVPVVDKANKRILVSPPEGLLDIWSVKKMRALDAEQKAKKLAEAEGKEAAERQFRLEHPQPLPPQKPRAGAGAVDSPSIASTSSRPDAGADAALSSETEEEEGEEMDSLPEVPRHRRRLPPERRLRLKGVERKNVA